MMSSLQEHESSTVSISIQKVVPHTEQEHVVLREKSDAKDPNFKQHLELPNEPDTATSNDRYGSDSPLYQSLEPPDESDTELDISGTDYSPADYESVTFRNQDTPLYQVLEPRNDDAEVYTNHAASECKPSKRRSETHMYEIPQRPLERSFDGSANTLQVGKKQLVSSSSDSIKFRSAKGMAYQDYRDVTISATMRRDSQGKGNPKRGGAIKLAIICCGILLLFMVTAIAIAALVLVLKNKSCPCQDDVLESFRIATENKERLDMLTANSDCQCPTSPVTCQCQDDIQQLFEIAEGNRNDIDEIYNKTIGNEVSIINNKLNVSTNAVLIDSINEATIRINATLSQSISNLRSMIRDLATCSSSLERTCTVSSSQQQCITDTVELTELTLSFTCFSMNQTTSLITTPIVSNAEIRCQCTRTREVLQSSLELGCGLVVTRCD